MNVTELQALKRELQTAPVQRVLEVFHQFVATDTPITQDDLLRPAAFFERVWPFLMPGSNWTKPGEILGPNPPRAFYTMVIEGRPDLAFLIPTTDEDDEGEDGAATPSQHPLARERVQEWIHLGNLGDGHQDLFWDPTHTERLRIVLSDNSEHEVLIHDWDGPTFLARFLLPQVIADQLATIAKGQNTAIAILGMLSVPAFVALLTWLYWVLSH